MRDVSIIGIGQTPVGEHWGRGLRDLSLEAIQAAMQDAGQPGIDGLFVGNMLGGELSRQEHLSALVADFAGMRGVSALRTEASGASGALALRQGLLAVASGYHNCVLVLGVEKMSDMLGSERDAAMLTSMDADYDGTQGVTPEANGGLLMRRYLHEYGIELADMAGFSVNAHANGALNERAMFRNRVKPESYARAPMVAEPVNLFDAAPYADGAAAVILVASESAPDLVPRPVRITGSAIATDSLSLASRNNPLELSAAALSANRAFEQAGIGPGDVNVFELHDEFSVLAAMSLEACGFANKGEGWKLAAEGQLGLDGRVPVSTFGGLKARGNPGGATGVYQVVEITRQLRGEAGDNQVPGAKIGVAQNLGSLGATAVTHVFETVD